MSRWGKEKAKNALPGKILLVSIVLIAVLAAVGYYFAANRSDSNRPGEVNLLSVQSGKIPPLPGGGAPEKTPAKEITASVQEQLAPAESKPTPPPPSRKEGEEGSPAAPPAPSVSSEPPSPAKIPQSVPAAAPQEAQAAAKEGEKLGKSPEIAKKPSVKKAEVPQKKDFFAIKILALADPKRVQAFIAQQKKKGFDVHSRTVSIQDKGVMHQIFLGHFGSREEALRFLNEKKIRQSYPDSVIMKLTR